MTQKKSDTYCIVSSTEELVEALRKLSKSIGSLSSVLNEMQDELEQQYNSHIDLDLLELETIDIPKTIH
ncbi:hypothetical protein [Teredinibacter sp. KSP-S5-2]|uniref:hypothetical protein n=1 Tax=Teredinibacter sp. KSP-S5-2 TaxID=3034506 RepID=UPI0029348BE6|nr:hypothetical protein [Teredinibacter sp. KSP-S5-2]WNO10164.1 hypothetical protein P5V12_03160 [Teredinibacter sp. KSP-S5-2]